MFLGVAALFYSLLLGYAAFTLAIMAFTLAVTRRSFEPLLRLACHRGDLGGDVADRPRPVAAGRAQDRPAGSGSAQHYLPAAGASLEFPMLRFTLLGALCMLGALWLVWRARSSTRAGALTVAVLAVYAWSLLSMLTTLLGTTLLSFRLQPPLTVLLAAAGAFGFIEVTLAIARAV